MRPFGPLVQSFGVGLLGIGFASSAPAAPITCSDLVSPEEKTIEISGDTNRFSGPCEVALQGDLTLTGAPSGAKLDLTPAPSQGWGLVVHLDGHELHIESLDFTFDHGYGIAILGNGTGAAHLKDVSLTDEIVVTSTTCDESKKRFGIIVHEVRDASLENVRVSAASNGPASLQGGVVLAGESGAATPPAPVVWNDGFVSVRCGLAAEGIHRAFDFRNVIVGAWGPCDLRPTGLSDVVQNGKPTPPSPP